MKRIFDFVVSLLLVIVFAPVFLIVSVLLKVTSGSPVFYSQIRIGKNQKTFRMYKFRTMKVGSDKHGHSTTANDDRITRIGKFLRMSSLDELPQLVNVLMGDMSMVGPRPYVPQQESENATDYWVQRHKVLPGITGLAQIRQRSLATHQQVIENDLEYVRNHNLWVDLSILFKTFGSLLKGR